jgi:hypothetical protein
MKKNFTEFKKLVDLDYTEWATNKEISTLLRKKRFCCVPIFSDLRWVEKRNANVLL